ncbi:hypothetical protein HYPBUDRAFT_158675 [Hyphopichia burtonii NRRL Y-1933]|uniref:Endonuclease/exonuclease/phosphatase domain-containing protein n=1 Tax=Hyphopichia burtonii NRRL Y-1933 TaxID=984485 RepID=A0A1E4RCX0_9ASCO|nr:hypothetical protein HYPBUDRAFT_158675 [Hyphopichia burtonii NRRL Y-1933]ODV65114.1 hypothetical protein HYPBUDRAFT_158675 [Hyphopichia burtonii NRRL Y-1933]
MTEDESLMNGQTSYGAVELEERRTEDKNQGKGKGKFFYLKVISITHFPNLVDPLNLRIYTNNIRFDNKNRDSHEKPWSKRKQLITSSIAFNTRPGNANVVCLQEVLHNQLEDILFNLNHGNEGEWTYYGVGRSDGLTRGEYAPILFKDQEWSVIENRTFWLSETPDVPSRGWDAALERIVTMVTLQSRVNPLIKINFFNTHYDHKGIEARRKSSLLIIDRMTNYNDYPSFLCGDFNTQPTDEPYHILKEHGFKDSRTLADSLNSYGHWSTFTGFDKHHEDNTIIDYIWAPYFAKNGNKPVSHELNSDIADINYYNVNLHQQYNIVIKAFGILHSYFDFYMSDHRPVVADYIVERSLCLQV